jgi:hypothetical protein
MARRRSGGLSYRGYVALADAVFGLAAGFMLLNPLRSLPPPPPAPLPRPCCEPNLGPAIEEREERLSLVLAKLRAQQNEILESFDRLTKK